MLEKYESYITPEVLKAIDAAEHSDYYIRTDLISTEKFLQNTLLEGLPIEKATAYVYKGVTPTLLGYRFTVPETYEEYQTTVTEIIRLIRLGLEQKAFYNSDIVYKDGAVPNVLPDNRKPIALIEWLPIEAIPVPSGVTGSFEPIPSKKEQIVRGVFGFLYE